MLGEARMLNWKPRLRHAFSLCRVVDPGTSDEFYELLGVVEVPVDHLHPTKQRDGLRPWAVATLAAGGYGFGRYFAGYTTLDEDDEPDKAITDTYIDWSGTDVLAAVERPTGQPRPADAVEPPSTQVAQ
jgi:hypothetical protein